MNTPNPATPSVPTGPRLARGLHRRKAVALVLVVSFVVLLSALVVSFFARVTTDLNTSRSYAEGVSVRQLAESAIGVVMGQIREATSVENACWASQPGMIRTYRGSNKLAGSAVYAFYKLYSSHDLIISTTNGQRELLAFDPTITTATSSNPVEVPLGTGGWAQQPAFFTDLNEPVDIPNPVTTSSTKTVKRYPVFDPTVAAIYNHGARPQKIKGRTSDGDTSAWLVEGSEIELDSSDRKTNDAPMPVRWMYVLKDGTLTAPTPLTAAATGTTGLVANWAAVGTDNSKTGVPTKDNPIVGRIAFWADDDSCKVNVNTAGGFLLPDGVDEDVNLNYTTPSPLANETNPGYYAGSFWDTPRVQTRFDRGKSNADASLYKGGLSNSQPGQNEFQRYPGHPSTTSLGLVFKYLLPAGKTGFDSEKLYAMTPRLMPGGSKNGTIYLDVTEDRPLLLKTAYPVPPDDPKNPRKDPGKNGYHLFGSVDEFYYSTMNGARQSAVDGINAWASSEKWSTTMQANAITTQMVDQSRFFLTAYNRAPELNLFGRPRVTMWPVPTAARETNLQSYNIRNASDDLIRFCSTIGRDPNPLRQAVTRQGEFIFDRQDPYRSGTLPSGAPDMSADFWMPRNQTVFKYLRQITSAASGQIPGFGGSFEQKYNNGPGGRDQILTEIFDYIRTINQKDGSRERAIDDATGVNTAANNALKAAARYAPHALVVPTRATIDGRKVSGFGRYPTISEASVVFYHGGFICLPREKGDDGKPTELAKYAADPLKTVIPGLTDKGGVKSIPGSKEVVIYDLNVVFPGVYPPGTSFRQNAQDPPVALKPDWVAKNVDKWTGKLVRAFVIFETFNPMQGYAPIDNFNNISLVNTKQVTNGKYGRYNYADPNKGYYVHELEIETNFSLNGQPLPIGSGVAGGSKLTNNFTRTSGETYDGRNFGGTEGFFHTMADKYGLMSSATNYYPFQSPCSAGGNNTQWDLNAKPSGFAHCVDFNPLSGVRVGFGDTSINFSGGKMKLNIRYEDQVGHKEAIQTVQLEFPAGNWPAPTANFRPDQGGFDARLANFDLDDSTTGQPAGAPWNDYLFKAAKLPSGWAMAYYLPSRIAWAIKIYPHNPMGPKDSAGNTWGDGKHYTNTFMQILQPGDVIRSLTVGGGDPAAADPRIGALQHDVTTFQKHPDYDSTARFRAETLRRAAGGFYFDPSSTTAQYLDPPGDTSQTTKPTTGSFIPLAGNKYRSGYGPDLVRNNSKGQPFEAKRNDGGRADFDTGFGLFADGAFAGKADEGNVAAFWWDDYWKKYVYVEPYFTWVYDNPLDTYFSPNRQVPGPGMFGSLSAPQSPWAQSGWKTLLFCPNPAGANHPGAVSPPDHLLLDLFTMPVVEPYAISEPFSTAGKVNLNYQMVPFSYITRSTALRAALHPLRVTAIPQTFKNGSEFRYKGQDNNENLRYLVDREETLKGFEAFFKQYQNNKNGGFFKSASQICERYLYPKGPVISGGTITYTTGEGPIKAFWEANQLTGDNLREKPYADLYPRITTKSNVFTVHYRVQTLRQRPYTGNAAGADAYYRSFDESRDQVLSELRGQATIERYLDPEDPRFLSTYTPASEQINVETQSLEPAYRFRVISNKRFSPW